ncbi:MAG: SDR family NAD(P)-dependent oxidoreductase [Hyphomonas sp.]
MLKSLSDNYRAAIFGATGGIGKAVTDRLALDPRCGRIYAGSRHLQDSGNAKVRAFQFDLEDELSIANAAVAIERDGPVEIVLIATGFLHGQTIQPEKSWRQLDPETFSHVLAINTIGPAIIGKHLLPLLARDRKSVFAALSARVGSVSDNRLGGWHAYRASKAALNMVIRNFAIELARTNGMAACVGLHPGTVDTHLSLPFQRGVQADRLFTPDFAADCLLSVVDRLTPDLSGRIFAWDGQEIPS